MSHRPARSPLFPTCTKEGHPMTRHNSPPVAQIRTSFPTVASTPPLKEKPNYDRPSLAQSLKSEKAIEPQPTELAAADSDDELSSVEGDSTTGSVFDLDSDQDSDVPLQELRAKQACVQRQGPRCNADQRAPHYQEPAIAELYEKMQAAAIRQAGGKWRPISANPDTWLEGEKSTAAIGRLFRRYNVVKPPYVRWENSRMIMGPRTTELREKRRQRRRTQRQRCATPEPPTRRSATSRLPVRQTSIRSPPPEPTTEAQILLRSGDTMLSRADIDALVSPSQNISLAMEDIVAEERRIEHLQEMIVPALRKKYAVLQVLKSFKQGSSTIERRLPLLNYPAIDQYERGTSEVQGTVRGGLAQPRTVERVSGQGSAQPRRTSRDSSSVTAFESEQSWRRF
ncbi:hypothetical protein BCV69DRAFT_277095 [Microstroma glucosiphilum]|uniref:Uncharacterized protein n=1 Tax=Pseudomicrostroma glucosiphilum TaxID=1684307 RepID=A0A316U6S3_9BASI|nr:hypothetical protein BCV69DRAFT_277095 [Pseudomicrostroma glucosiphilum]PWN20956.1 hypothetical protein BCV69DRAFT_277095 [Pseudomicrostroma glucosiphilum]